MTRDSLSVGEWLGAGLAVAGVVLVGVGAAALGGLHGIDREVDGQVRVIQPRSVAAHDLERRVLALGIAARAQALAPAPERAHAVRAAERALAAAAGGLAALPKDDDGAALFAPVPALVSAYRARARALAAAPAAAVPPAEDLLRATREELLDRVGAYSELQDAKLAASVARVDALRRRARRLLVWGIAAALALLAATAVTVGRGVRRPLLRLAALARRIEAGDYAAAAALPATAPPRPPRSELAELAYAFGAMAGALREREERIASQNEELQAQNEELHAQKEELQAQNEEIQAQNEEIQAQSEELQSQGEELQAQNEELRASEDALRDADRRKDDFLAVLSHELRNPLAPIVHGLAILGRAPPGSDAAERARETLSRQVKQLVRLVDDLLDVTRIARGKAELRRRETDLAAIVRHAAEDHRALLERRGLRLELAIPPGPVPAWADPERISQVVANLVQNSAKFTPAGGTVRVRCELQDGRARLRVTDDGEGISPELLARLFVPFVQADGSLARTRGGLGLGLALVKGIAELHGGTVRAASDGPGRGAEFTVELPLGAAPGAAAPAGTGDARGREA